MTEQHRRAKARQMLSNAGYKSGGHFKPDGSPAKRLIGEAVREHEDALHKGKPHTKLKLKDGGSVQSAAFGARIHKPRGMGKGKKAHTTVNVVVGGPKPVPVPIPVGGPPPMGPGGGPPLMGAGAPPMGLPGQPPGGPMPGAKKGGRYCDGGSVKGKDSQRDSIKSTAGKVEGKLKKGGKARKSNHYDLGGPIASGGNPWGGSPIMQASPQGGMGTSSGPGVAQGSPIMGVSPQAGGGGMANPPHIISGPETMGGGMNGGGGGTGIDRQPIPTNLMRNGPSCGNYKRGGKIKMPDMEGGAGGGLGRLEKAESYGAKVKHGGRAKH